MSKSKADRPEVQLHPVCPYIVSLWNGDKLVREFVIRSSDYGIVKEIVVQKILAGKLPEEFTEVVISGRAQELTRWREA